MDTKDEFEMKPLTPGLGFHKRQVTLKEHMMKTGIAQQNLRRSLPPQPPEENLSQTAGRSSQEIINELKEAVKPNPKKQKSEALKLTEILPRDISDVPGQQRPEISPLQNIRFQIPDKAIAENTAVRRGASDNLVKPLTPVSVSIPSMLLDAALSFALALVFLVCLIMVTGVNLLSVVRSTQTEFATQLSLFVLYLAVFEMYVIVARSFFGCTVGEWTFDLQLGEDEQVARSYYPALVLWRTLLNFLTGLILLPLLSLIFNRDLAAKFTGLQLYRRNF